MLRRKQFYRARKRRMRHCPYGSIELGNCLFGLSRGQFHVERDWREDAFHNFLKLCGFDTYGHFSNRNDPRNIKRRKDFGFETDRFIIRPYYWGDNHRKMRRPNFVYKSRGYQLKWFKYPLRDAYENKVLSDDEFLFMLLDCALSIGVRTCESDSPSFAGDSHEVALNWLKEQKEIVVDPSRIPHTVAAFGNSDMSDSLMYAILSTKQQTI